MTPLISEFSYGYAITDELIHGLHTPITAAPVFPSLHEEGQTGGGYDVMLPRPAIPLFLQFKLSNCLTTRNASESKAGLLSTPYYRMHLRARKHSRQHELLLDLESHGNDVYYTAPAFHKDDELNDAYLTQNVCARSMWLRPSFFGPLPDDELHYAAFQDALADRFYCCSQPRVVTRDSRFTAFIDNIVATLARPESLVPDVDRFERLADKLMRIASDQRLELQSFNRFVPFAELPAVQRAAILAKVLFDTQLYIATLKEAEQSNTMVLA